MINFFFLKSSLLTSPPLLPQQPAQIHLLPSQNRLVSSPSFNADNAFGNFSSFSNEESNREITQKISTQNSYESQMTFSKKPKEKEMLTTRLSELYMKMDQIKQKNIEFQQINYVLSVELNKYKEKIKAKQFQLNMEKNKYDQLFIEYEATERDCAEKNKVFVENEQLKKINYYLQKQIEIKRNQLLKNQTKNSQSLKLLELLNHNITKREEKLTQQLTQQENSHKKLNNQRQAMIININDIKLQLGTEKQKRKLQKKESQEIINQLRQKLFILQKEINQKIKIVSETTIYSSQLEKEVKQKHEQISNLRQINKQITNKLLISDSLYQQRLNQRQKQNNGYIAQIKELSIKNHDLLKQNAQKQVTIKQIQLQFFHKKLQIESHWTAIEQNLKQIIKQNQMNMKSQEKLKEKQLQRMLKQKEEKIAHLQFQKQETINQNNQKTTLYKKLQQKFHQIEMKMQNQLLVLKQVENQKQKLKQQSLQLKKQVRQKSIQLQKKNEQFNMIQNQLKQIKSIIFQKQAEINAKKSTNDTHIEQIEKLQKQISQLKQNKIQNNTKLKKYQTEIEMKGNTINQFIIKNKKYQLMLSKYKTEIQRMTSQRDVQWKNLKSIYESQIKILQQKIEKKQQMNIQYEKNSSS